MQGRKMTKLRAQNRQRANRGGVVDDRTLEELIRRAPHLKPLLGAEHRKEREDDGVEDNLLDDFRKDLAGG